MLRIITLISIISLMVLSCKINEKDEPTPTSPFSVTQIEASSKTVSTGDILKVNITFQNNTDESVSSLLYNFYLSDDDEYDSDDEKLRKPEIEDIKKGINKVSAEINIPVGIKSGKYYLIFRYKDSNQSSSEYQIISSAEQIDVKKSRESFTLVGLSLDKTSYTSGSQIILSITGKNTFTTTLYPSLYYYLSEDAMYDSNDLSLSNFSSYSFVPGTSTVRATSTLSESIVGNFKYLIVMSSYQSNTSTVVSPINVRPVLSVSGFTTGSTSYSTNQLLDSYIVVDNLSSSSKTVYINYYLSKDDKYSSNDYILNSGNFSYETISSNSSQIVSKSSSISSNTPQGTYYIIANVGISSYSSNGQYIVGPQVTITKAPDPISITGFSISSNSYISSGSIPLSLSFYNSGSTSYSLNVNYYLSTDTTYSSSTDSYLSFSGSSYPTANVGNNSLSSNLYISSSQSKGEFYILMRYSYYHQNETKYFTYVGPRITVKEPVLSVTSVAFSNTTVTQGGDISATMNVLSDISTYTYAYYYLSTDNVYSSNDITLNSSYDYISLGQGTNIQTISKMIPLGTSSGNYYLIVRYQSSSNSSNYITKSSSNVVSVLAPIITFYRNNSSSYSNMYLFIDDVFVSNLSSYETWISSATCSTNFSYENSHYKFYGAPGNHTYKVRSQNSLTSGVDIKSGTLTVANGNCITVDID